MCSIVGDCLTFASHLRRTREIMTATDGAEGILPGESPVHDAHGTGEKARDKSALESNAEANDIGVAPLTKGEEAAASSRAVEETEANRGVEDEHDTAKAEGDTSNTSRADAVDGSERECPVKGEIDGKRKADGSGVVTDDMYRRVRATALATINAVSELAIPEACHVKRMFRA